MYKFGCRFVDRYTRSKDVCVISASQNSLFAYLSCYCILRWVWFPLYILLIRSLLTVHKYGTLGESLELWPICCWLNLTPIDCGVAYARSASPLYCVCRMLFREDQSLNWSRDTFVGKQTKTATNPHYVRRIRWYPTDSAVCVHDRGQLVNVVERNDGR